MGPLFVEKLSLPLLCASWDIGEGSGLRIEGVQYAMDVSRSFWIDAWQGTTEQDPR